MSKDAGSGLLQRVLGWFLPASRAAGAAAGAVPESAGPDAEELARQRIKERMANIESRISGTLNVRKDADALDLAELPGLPRQPAPAQAGDIDDGEGLIFIEDADADEPTGVDAALARFSRIGLEHPVAAELFKLSMRRQAKRIMGEAGPDIDKALEFLLSDAAWEPNQGRAPSPEELVRGDARLAAMPDVYARLNEALKEQNCKIERIAALIGMDPALSATLLKMVNSAFYGRTMRQTGGRFPVRVESLSRAVTVIGEARLSNLALAVSVLPLFQNMPRDVADVRSFWRHSLGAAIFARSLAKRAGLDDPERFFLAGLLHDIGRLAAYRRIPSHCLNALALSVGEKITLTEAERRIFGWDHAELGGILLSKWQYPKSLIRAVAGHHDLESIAREEACAVTHLADILAIALDFGSSGERFIPPAAPGAWERLGLDPKALGEVAEEAEREFEAVFQSMLPGGETDEAGGASSGKG